jgi:hypothetical protein
MPNRILTQSYPTQPKRLYFDRGDFLLLPRQQIVWVTLAPEDVHRLDPAKHSYFPAVIDTGFSGTFFINGRQVESWPDLRLGSGLLWRKWDLNFGGNFENLYGFPVPLFDGKVWLYREQPPNWNEDQDARVQISGAAIPLAAETGVAVMLQHPSKHITRNPRYRPAFEAVHKILSPDVIDFLRKRPPLPLIGMRLLEENKLQYQLDGNSRQYSIFSA